MYHSLRVLLCLALPLLNFFLPPLCSAVNAPAPNVPDHLQRTNRPVTREEIEEFEAGLMRIMGQQVEIYKRQIQGDEQLLAYKSDDTTIWNRLGRNYRDLGWLYRELEHWPEAQRAYQHAIDLGLKDTWIYNDLGVAYHRQYRWEEAAAAFKKATELEPENILYHRNLGWVSLHLEQWKETATAFRRAIELGDRDADTYNKLGFAYEKQYQWKKAAAAFKKAIDREPKAASYYSSLGWAYAQLKSWPEAITAYRKARRLDPDDDKTYLNLVWAYFRSGRTHEAQKALDEALRRISPDRIDAYKQLVFPCRELGLWNHVIDISTQLIRLEPNNISPYVHIAEAYQELGRTTEAHDMYIRALSIKPAEDAWAYINLARTYEHLGRFNDATAAYQHAISLDPTETYNTRLYLGWLYRDHKKWNQAAEMFQQATRLKPNNASVFVDLGDAKAALNRWPEAITAYKRARTLDPKNVRVHERLMEMYLNSRRWDDAVESIKQVVALQPDLEESYLSLGPILVLAGRYSEAQHFARELEKALETVDDVKQRVLAFGAMAYIYSATGTTEQGAELAYKALALYQGLPVSSRTAGMLDVAGDLHFQLGLHHERQGDLDTVLEELDQARRLYEQTLAFYRADKDGRGETLVLPKIGGTYLLRGHLADEQGDVLKAKEEFERAAEWLRKAVGSTWQTSASREGWQSLLLGFNLFGLGQTYLELEQYEKARDTLEKAADTVRNIPYYSLSSHLLAFTARAYEKLGQPEEALALSKQAAQALAKEIPGQEPEQLKVLFSDMRSSAHRQLARLLLTQQGQRPQSISEAFESYENGKARLLRQRLTRAGVTADHIPSPLQNKSTELMTQKTLLRRQLLNLSQPKVNELRPWATTLDRERLLANFAKLERDQLAIEAKISQHENSTGIVPPLTNIETVKEVLQDENTLLLEYMLGTEQSFLWAITNKSVVVYSLPPEKDIAESLQKYMTGGVPVSRYFDSGRKPFIWNVDGAFNKSIGSLADVLFGEALPLVREKRKLIIIPDAVLHYFPFETLVLPLNADTEITLPPKSPQFLVDTHTISYVSSASTLVQLSKRTTSRTQDQDKALLLFAPSIEPTNTLDHTVASVPVSDSMRADSVVKQQVNSTQFVYVSEAIETIKEQHESASLPVSLHKDEEATERYLREQIDLLRYHILYFFGHGVLSDSRRHISQPALVFSWAGNDERYDDFWEMKEIYQAKLAAKLVLLPFCESTRGKTHDGEGVMGLARAFLSAGAQAVVATLWQVNPRSTALFIKFFHQALLDGDRSITAAAALQKAKKRLMKTKEFSNPYYWAPFILVGADSMMRLDHNGSSLNSVQR